ncbi:hypothetical protein [Youngiibacter fragilis]|uniref:Uncharacterized protein n=1 Tax=Youngiibacter fragilis 232.1 TaxID=994573 RepID=V7I4A3_9CLOT|nr:hypothetical protein [Youngiibacter fragilis]ETA80029.1 hypothetical protein T472_0213875 [Youngiibacter fragilis 232.1]
MPVSSNDTVSLPETIVNPVTRMKLTMTSGIVMLKNSPAGTPNLE